MAEFHLETERLVIRNWREEDRDLMHLINSNDQVMEFFPIGRNREESDALLGRRLIKLLEMAAEMAKSCQKQLEKRGLPPVEGCDAAD